MENIDEGTTSTNGATTKKNRSTVNWGPELPMPPLAAQTERDALLLRSVMRNEALATYDQELTPGAAADLANEDIAAIGEIKDKAMRKQAMLSARHSRQARPDYKVEFTRLAQALAREVDATRSARNTHAPALILLKRDAPAPVNPLDPAVRAKVAAFLYSDPETVIKRYPDLAPAYGNLHAARKFAERNFNGHEQKFVDLAIDAVVGNIKRGEPIPDPGLKVQIRQNGDRRDVHLPRAAGPQLVR